MKLWSVSKENCDAHLIHYKSPCCFTNSSIPPSFAGYDDLSHDQHRLASQPHSARKFVDHECRHIGARDLSHFANGAVVGGFPPPFRNGKDRARRCGGIHGPRTCERCAFNTLHDAALRMSSIPPSFAGYDDLSPTTSTGLRRSHASLASSWTMNAATSARAIFPISQMVPCASAC